MDNIYVNCGGSLDVYKNKKAVMNFFEDCIYSSEGAERDRYVNIYFSVKDNLNTSKRCFTDGSDYVTRGNVNPEVLDDNELKLLYKNYGVTEKELYKFRADKFLGVNHKRISNYELQKYNSLDDIYTEYISKGSDKTLYILGEEKITCIDANAKEPDKYWTEEFFIKDYNYANKWLNGEIEIDDYHEYLKEKNKKKEIGIFNGNKLYLTVGRYRNNDSMYLGLITDEDEDYSDITINISDTKIKDNIAYLTNDMSKELKDFLREKELISESILFMKHNLGEYEMVYVDLNKVKEYDPKGYENFFKKEEKDIEM